MNSSAPFSPSAAIDALAASGNGGAGMVLSAIAGAVAIHALRYE